jgi:hypothetical protein
MGTESNSRLGISRILEGMPMTPIINTIVDEQGQENLFPAVVLPKRDVFSEGARS